MKTKSLAALLSFGALLLGGCATPPPSTKDYPAPSSTVVAPTSPSVSSSSSASPGSAPLASAPTGVSSVAVVDPSVGERALVSAIAAYERGEFSSAIRQLTPLTNDGSLDAAQQLRALKSLAFSQCSSNARTLCRQTFERALRADPTFELAPAERGHPLWQPEFERARKVVLGR